MASCFLLIRDEKKKKMTMMISIDEYESKPGEKVDNDSVCVHFICLFGFLREDSQFQKVNLWIDARVDVSFLFTVFFFFWLHNQKKWAGHNHPEKERRKELHITYKKEEKSSSRLLLSGAEKPKHTNTRTVKKNRSLSSSSCCYFFTASISPDLSLLWHKPSIRFHALAGIVCPWQHTNSHTR